MVEITAIANKPGHCEKYIIVSIAPISMLSQPLFEAHCLFYFLEAIIFNVINFEQRDLSICWSRNWRHIWHFLKICCQGCMSLSWFGQQALRIDQRRLYFCLPSTTVSSHSNKMGCSPWQPYWLTLDFLTLLIVPLGLGGGAVRFTSFPIALPLLVQPYFGSSHV